MSLSGRAKVRWLLAVVAVLVAAALAFDGEGLKKDRVMREQAAQLRVENVRLAGENARLAREARALRTRPAALERAAREELRFIRPGELVYRLDPVPGATP
ncbi:MAG: septum formation initiator family protein [Anaeromyxobacter sp.]|nr:septum formation initiator family protein [Anaeromyxobacter sp.]MBL0277820.1 septum formation initiator family protein [Anaeromyxobacter sp.]